MSGQVFFAYIALPLMVGALGMAAFVLFIRSDDALRRAEAEADSERGEA